MTQQSVEDDRLREIVKPLEWGSTSYGTPEALSAVGVYRINEAVNGGWSVVVGGLHGRPLVAGDGRENFASVPEAKAAAQADYATRVLSAIDTELLASRSKTGIFNVRALYAHPTPTPGGVTVEEGRK